MFKKIFSISRAIYDKTQQKHVIVLLLKWR
jgi:hypothetical protein